MASPAPPAHRGDAPAANRRRGRRYQLQAPGYAADQEAAYPCVVADISIGGALLEGDLPFEVGQELALAFDNLIGVRCEVAQVRDAGIGVRFTGGADQRLVVLDWVDGRIRASRSGG